MWTIFGIECTKFTPQTIMHLRVKALLPFNNLVLFLIEMCKIQISFPNYQIIKLKKKKCHERKLVFFVLPSIMIPFQRKSKQMIMIILEPILCISTLSSPLSQKK